MTYQLFIPFLMGIIGCFNQSIPVVSNEYTWTKIMDSADWKKSYNFQMFTIQDTLWTFHHDGNWYSADGSNWKKSSLPNAIHNHAFLDYVVFKNAVFGLGHFEGNIEDFNFKPTIYRTTDRRHWEILAENSNLPDRFFYHPFVFGNKIWIIGGEDKSQQFADLWNSVDGVHWNKVKDQLPFGKRSQSQVIEFKDRLYLLDNDVWSSADAINWTRESTAILPGEEVFGYAPVVFDNQIWLLGCNRNGRFKSQAFSSTDGKNWQEQSAPWTPRGGVAASVLNDRIFITGGKYGGLDSGNGTTEFVYSNDIWALSKADSLPFPKTLTHFKPYEKNPVFTGTGVDTWDTHIRERGYILKEGDTYHMWYGGFKDKENPVLHLGYASSPDGINWTRYPGNPLLKEDWVEDMTVIKSEGTYYMFAEGLNDIAHLLTSTDKIHWTEKGNLDIRYTNGKPLSAGPYGTPAIWKENSTWYLFYERGDMGIWLASSKDLKTFTNVQDEPVIRLGPEPYDKAQVAINQVIKYEGIYYGYYHALATDTSANWSSCVAASRDLIHWQKFSGNPIMEENKSSPLLVYDGKQYRLYTMHPNVAVHFPAP